LGSLLYQLLNLSLADLFFGNPFTGLMITEKIAAATEAHAVATIFVLEGGNGHSAANQLIALQRPDPARRLRWTICEPAGLSQTIRA